jgi:hypothetical protein
MKERPILFSAPMVRAILEGPKTMTRRIVNPDLASELEDGRPSETQRIETDETPMGGVPAVRFCPYGGPGDRLRVKEACWIWGAWRKNGTTKTGRQRWRFYEIDPRRVVYDKPEATAKRGGGEGWVYRHSRYMPRWASRISLDVTAVRVERLQEITEADAKAEGVTAESVSAVPGVMGYVAPYAELWDSLNAERGYGWDVNPWVWVLTFRRAKQETAP